MCIGVLVCAAGCLSDDQEGAPEPLCTSDPVLEPGGFGETGPPVIARSLHTATLLQDGRVLVAGGNNLNLGVLDSAELYDPGATTLAAQDARDGDTPPPLTGVFEATGALLDARQTHAATRLADGRVLITGGVQSDGTLLRSAEIFDPATGTFSSTGEMTAARSAHDSVLLSDGRVLIVGGFGNPPLASTEIYDPESGTFTESGDMRFGRQFLSLITLPDGRVLVHGGGLDPAADPPRLAPPEVYDSAVGTFSLIDTPAGVVWPSQVTALSDGTVLLTGICCGEDGVSALGTAAILDPVTGEVDDIGPMHDGRFGHESTLLPGGRVLLTGGNTTGAHGFDDQTAAAEVFDPATRTFRPVAPMSGPRRGHTATRLPDGRVLVIGQPDHPDDRAAEVFLPPLRPSG